MVSDCQTVEGGRRGHASAKGVYEHSGRYVVCSVYVSNMHPSEKRVCVRTCVRVCVCGGGGA